MVYTRVCRFSTCGEIFTTTDRRKVYCSNPCRRYDIYDQNSHRFQYVKRVTGESYLYKREWAVKSRKGSRERSIEFLGGKCLHCGYSDHRALQIDHVNGNGRLDRSSETKIKSNPDSYQLLCANCNWIKRIVQGEMKRFGPESSRSSLALRYRSRIKLEAYSLLGDICCHCGQSDIRCLQIDHVNGDGHKKRAEGGTLYLQVKAHPEEHQILCANCNWVKRAVNKEYRGRPHLHAV